MEGLHPSLHLTTPAMARSPIFIARELKRPPLPSSRRTTVRRWPVHTARLPIYQSTNLPHYQFTNPPTPAIIASPKKRIPDTHTPAHRHTGTPPSFGIRRPRTPNNQSRVPESRIHESPDPEPIARLVQNVVKEHPKRPPHSRLGSPPPRLDIPKPGPYTTRRTARRHHPGLESSPQGLASEPGA